MSGKNLRRIFTDMYREENGLSDLRGTNVTLKCKSMNLESEDTYSRRQCRLFYKYIHKLTSKEYSEYLSTNTGYLFSKESEDIIKILFSTKKIKHDVNNILEGLKNEVISPEDFPQLEFWVKDLFENAPDELKDGALKAFNLKYNPEIITIRSALTHVENSIINIYLEMRETETDGNESRLIKFEYSQLLDLINDFNKDCEELKSLLNRVMSE